MGNFAELLALFKQLIGIQDVDTSQDATLTAYLNGAIAACETYLDRIVISQRIVTERLVNIRAPRMLRYTPVGDLQTVELDGEDVAGAWEIIKRTDYAELHNINDVHFCVDYDEELVVTYEAGFETCPYDLMLAVCYAASAIRSQSGAGVAAPGAAVKKEMVTGIGTIEYDLEASVGGTKSVGLLPPQTIQVLDLYRGYYGA